MSRANGLLTAALVVAVTCGWGSCSNVVKPPKIEYVEVEKAKDLPDNLLLPCPIEEPKDDSVREMRRVVEARKLSLQGCNIDKEALNKLDSKKDK